MMCVCVCVCVCLAFFLERYEGMFFLFLAMRRFCCIDSPPFMYVVI